MKQIVTALLLLLLYSLEGACVDIDIDNQSDFDKIASTLKSCINSGEKSIWVNIRPGTYFFSECHIMFDDMNCPDVDISICGKDAVVLSKGRDYRGTDISSAAFSPYKTLLDADGRVLDLFSPVYRAKSTVRVVEPDKNLCALKTACNLLNRKPEQCANAYISLSEWFKTAVYKVEYVLDNEIFFIADNLSFDSRYGDYNVNADYYYGSQYPSFRVYGFDEVGPGLLSVTAAGGHVHESDAMRFLFLKNSSFKSFRLDGLTILGNWNNGYFLIDIANVSADSITVSNCCFYGIKSNVIRFLNSPNSNFISNRMENNCLDGLLIDEKSACSLVKGNYFKNNGMQMTNSFCVRCSGGDYHVIGNVFENFGYGGIAVGISHYGPYDVKSYGVVEENELFYTDEYIAGNLIPMDSGAIYLFTQNDGAEVRYNYIHSISGRKDNRGIFCDDGACNFKIYGNIILDIENSYCIDSRRVPSGRLVNKTLQTNVNNFIGGNLLDGNVRFERAFGPSNCIEKKNYTMNSVSLWPYKKKMQQYLKRIK